jgi:hypothetical protein
MRSDVMKTIEKGDKVTFVDSKEYKVIDIIYYNNEKYIYMVRGVDEFEFMLGKEIKTPDRVMIETVTDKDELVSVMTEILRNYNNQGN